MATSGETIGERIRRLRREQGLSQRDIAAPGISHAYVSRLEAGRRKPARKAVRLLARRLGVSPEYLETGSRVPGHALRERRLADAELELRLDRDVERAESTFRAEVDGTSGFVHDDVLAARSHAGLGLLAARRTHLREAILHLEAATRSGYFDPVARPDLYEVLGTVYTARGAPAKAIALLEQCFEEVSERAADDAALAVRFLKYLALAASALGDPLRVREALAEATERAGKVELPQLWIGLYWALAISEWSEDRADSAQEYVERTIELLETTEDTVQLGRAHVLYAQILTFADEFEEADLHLRSAEHALCAADASDRGLLRAEQAKVAAARGDAHEALALARTAESLLGNDVRYAGTRWHALAAARAADGQVEAASAAYAETLRLLEERRQWREAAQVAREAARFLVEARREVEAWELLEHLAVLRGRRPARATHAG